MAWAQCQYSRGEIDKAGEKILVLPHSDPTRDAALEVINNWRSCHSYPLHIVAKTLQDRARKQISTNALVARRIKRMSSIQLKLRHNPAMKLSQMQDIGGCRAVLNSVVEVEDLVRVYNEALAKHPNPTDRPFQLKTNDYIQNPKSDGYRSVHLIMKYQSPSKKVYNGQRVEIQIRSKLQHAWATAVETCQTFTGQAIKSKVKQASANWLRFFALMSSAIAAREKRAIVPETPSPKDRKSELREIESHEKIITQLQAWNTAISRQESDEDANAVAYLLKLDIEARVLNMTSFKENEMLIAHAKYLEIEKATEGNPNVQVVLVSADSVTNLRRAYPNFYVDTGAFIEAIQQEIY